MKIAIWFVVFIFCMGMCIHDALHNNMFCVVWAVNWLINFDNLKESCKQ